MHPGERKPDNTLAKGQEPLVTTWRDEDVDESKIEEWSAQFPEAAIAFLLEPSGLIVVDAEGAIAQKKASSLFAPTTTKVTTYQGTHYYFRRPKGCPRLRAANVGPNALFHIYSNEYVMAPPSKHQMGFQYKGHWQRGEDKKIMFNEAPQWVIDALYQAAKPKLHPMVSEALLRKKMDMERVQPGGEMQIEGIVEDTLRRRDKVLKAKATQDPGKVSLKDQRAIMRREREDSRLEMVKAIISTAPVGKDHRVPQPWHLSAQKGVFYVSEPKKEEIEGKPVFACRRPVLVSQVLKDDDEDIFFKLAWHRKKRWHEHIVPAKTVANTSKIQDLAAKGLPVTSENAYNLVRFISDYELQNEDVIKSCRLKHHLGWANPHGKGLPGVFLWGDQVITAQGCQAQDDIIFKANSAGAQQRLRAYAKEGSIDGWYDAYESIAEFPLVRFSVFVSLAAPLLELAGAPNFVVDWSGVSSRGKSTALKFGSSVWGNPTTQGLISTWRNSITGTEKVVSTSSHMPMYIDDTKQARSSDIVSAMIYEVVNGVSAARGSVGDGGIGLQRQSHWRTIMMSTGEKPAVEFGNDGGARARCISITGHPMGEKTAENRELAERLEAMIALNHGHIGPRFIEHVIKKHWEGGLRVQVADYSEVFAAELIKHKQNPRKARYFAIIALAAEIVSEVTKGRVSMSVQDLLDFCGTLVVDGDSDRANQALEAMAQFTLMNPDAFWKSTSSQSFGREFVGVLKDQHHVAIPTFTIDSWLEDRGFESSLRKIWKARGHIDCGPRGTSKQITVDGRKISCVVFKWSALWPKEAQLELVG